LKFVKFTKEELVVALLAIGTYIACLINDFHTDDWIVLSHLRDGFSRSDLFSMENAGRFRPLTNVIVYLRYLIFGDIPFFYYALNVLLHAVVSVSLFRLLVKLELPERAALISAVFFAVYFQHYEAVIWLYGIIRELAALAYIISFRHLHDYVKSASGKSFWLFAVFSFLGLFIVEDFVAAPVIFAVFVLFFADKNRRMSSFKPVAIAGIVALAIYFTTRSMAIARPGIMEEYYYPGRHVIRVLFEYFGWFVIPSPAHSYFQATSAALPLPVYYIWRGISCLAIFGFLPFSIWLFVKSPGQVRFFIVFVIIAMLPIIPLNYKVGSRNIYLPSLGLAVMFGYLLFDFPAKTIRSWFWRKAIPVAALFYMGISVIAINVTSRQYHKTQEIVGAIVDDLQDSGAALNDYKFVLLDHVPGRAVIGPAMIYKLHYKRDLIASNDPVAGPIDIAKTTDSLYNEGVPIIVFDCRNGHMVEATGEYISRADSGGLK